MRKYVLFNVLCVMAVGTVALAHAFQVYCNDPFRSGEIAFNHYFLAHPQGPSYEDCLLSQQYGNWTCTDLWTGRVNCCDDPLGPGCWDSSDWLDCKEGVLDAMWAQEACPKV